MRTPNKEERSKSNSLELLSYRELVAFLQKELSASAWKEVSSLFDAISEDEIVVSQLLLYFQGGDTVFSHIEDPIVQRKATLSLVRHLYLRFLIGEMIFGSWQELREYFNLISGKRQSFPVPLLEDTEYPTIYGQTVGERLGRISLDFFSNYPGEQFDELIELGIPGEIAMAIVRKYIPRLTSLDPR
jgi:hypothetical protein